MSGMTINEFPSEIIIKILRFLDQRNLRNATLTCKLWSSLIESSCRWSVELYHNNKVGCDEPWLDFMLTTNRKFQTIKLNKLQLIGQKATIEIFQRHGINIVKMYAKLRHVIIFETSTLWQLSDVPPERDLQDLKKLKTLEMVASEYSIIKCFQRGKLTTIKIVSQDQEHSLFCGPLEDFLKSQEDLRRI